ncbi:MAG TPA: AAA family ATPase [Acidocella sp.]|uniref:AAA family ATPase n=1 Tax=Acidocella sp. TaxID=50710 RepID=UPI002C3BAA5E|nr:AAA family ATPase [Acidocella sp.]HVE23074.1 AAA family ATPase [Acidocella sp.]
MPVLVVAPLHDHPPASILQRLEHEYKLRDELDAAWAARPLALWHEGGRVALLLEDPGGWTLDRSTGVPLSIDAFLRLAIPLTASVGQAHARGLIHKDLKPANILVDRAGGGVRLTGFGIATRLPHERQAPGPPERIAGTLAYMAPEQTGRMNRSVDARSDLYALGVIFYELLTGILPFTAAEPIEWVHCHIARQPVRPDEQAAHVPKTLADIVMKLLGKTAEQRYQTAAGVEADLRRGLASWETLGRIDPFPLGAHDVPDRLLIPETLFGRERETARLLAAFERVLAQGMPELVLVSGYSGIGKSSVVQELHKALVPPHGLFASGKFERYKHDIPYATIGQALHGLVHDILGKSDAEVGSWRTALRAATGPNGQLIVNLVPELAFIIGPQPPVPDLPPRDAQRRFHLVFWRFLTVFAQAAHPLVLFLDDLQWLDAATLDLLAYLFTRVETRHFLLVGAYRDNEVGAAHPLMRMLAAIRGAGVRVQDIVLAPLGFDDVSRLVAASLHCEPDRAAPLAQLVQAKTGGNPFFVIQFLTMLVEEGALHFDPAVQAWQWDIDRLRARGYTDNVVALMAVKLKRLPASTRESLQALACLGNEAELATLALAHGTSDALLHETLADAMQAGLVVRLEDGYRFPHDRIQQAAYALLPESERADVHLRMGRRLFAGMTGDDRAEHLFEIANQFNRGAALLTDRHEKVRVAEINLRAGRKAKAAAAYASAGAYFAAGMALLKDSDWGHERALTFNLWLERAECAFLTGDLAATERLLAALRQRGVSKLDLAAVCQLQILLHTVRSENQQAVASALACLHLFGIDISAHPPWEQVQSEHEMVWESLEGHPLESLIDLPLMTDPALQAAMQVLSTLLGPAYFTDSQLFFWLVCRMVNITRQHGACGASAHGIAYFGCILGPAFHRYNEGYRFVRLAVGLVEKHGFIADQAKVEHSMGIAALWTQPIATAIDFNRAAIRTAAETGDLTSACYSMERYDKLLMYRNDPLDIVWQASEESLAFIAKAGFRDIADMIVSHQRFIAVMQGRTSSPASFGDAPFDEAAFEAQFTADRTAMMVCFYWILKLKARFLSGDYEAALTSAEKAKALLWSAAAHIELLDYFTYGALTMAALYDTAPPAQQAEWRHALRAHQDQLREWADSYEPTFGGMHALISAERARLEGRDADAMGLYEQAIQSARRHGFVQNEGLAHEAAARFYAARGGETIAQTCWRNAHFCYLRWGAAGIVSRLERAHPWLRDEPPPPSGTMLGAGVEQLDARAMMKASQALSGEIVLDRLIETLMTLALEHAGAERGLLVLLPGDRPRVGAEARIDRKTVTVTLRHDIVTPADMPDSVLCTVTRTGQNLILDDATAQTSFSADAYVRQKRVRSVLCLPLLKQTKLVGLLYLENNLVSHVFTPARAAILQLLASQAAISLENAHLYADLLRENHERQAAEAAMRVSEARWHSLFVNVPVGVTSLGTDGRFAEVNPAFCTMTGYSAAELLELSPADITLEDDRPATEAFIAAQTAGTLATPRIEKRYRRKDGNIIWVEVSAFRASRVENLPLRAAVSVDITERKRAETALRRSEAYLAEAQRLSRTGSFGWNVSRDDIFWSAESSNIFGYEQVSSANIEMVLQRVHPEDFPLVQRVIEHASQTGSDFDFEHRLLMQDGAVKYVHVVGRAVRDPAEELEFIGSVMDVTAAKHAEEELHAAQATLTHAARVMTLGELAASIAHEINQPLAAIATSGNACLRWLARTPPDLMAARQAAARIVQDAHRAGEVMRSLRALTSKSEPRLSAFDMNDAIRDALLFVRNDIHRQGVILNTELAADIQPVLGDRVQLQQVLLNLITNGIDAMDTVTEKPRALTISSECCPPDSVLVSVRDTGTGVDPTVAKHIFSPFYTTKSEGMGMGLSISKTIIEAHGGELWAQPNMPQGAIFQFRLPAAGQGVA